MREGLASVRGCIVHTRDSIVPFLYPFSWGDRFRIISSPTGSSFRVSRQPTAADAQGIADRGSDLAGRLSLPPAAPVPEAKPISRQNPAPVVILLDPEEIRGHGFQAEIEQDDDGRWVVREIGFASGRVLRPEE